MSVTFATALPALVLSVASLVWMLVEDVRAGMNRAVALFLGAVAWIAACEILRGASLDARSALGWTLAAAPAWLAMGPLVAQVAVATLPTPPSRGMRRLLACSWSAVILGTALCWTTDWLYVGVTPSAWGWQVVAGPGFAAIPLAALAHGVPAAVVGLRRVHETPSPSGRNLVAWIVGAALVPVIAVFGSQVIPPLVGVASPRVGSLGLALFGACLAWVTHHYGYLPLRRGSAARQILDSHPDGVALVLLDGRIGTASEGLGRLVGAPAESLVGRGIDEILSPALGALVEVRDREGQLRTSSGRVIPVSLSTRFVAPLAGSPPALVAVFRDLRELVALRSRLVTSGRLAAIGQLAAGIAHEINNPMAFVRANLALLRSHWSTLAKSAGDAAERARLADEGEELLEESLEGVERACTIVRDINGFAHAGSGARSAVDLSRLLENVLRVASPHLGAGIRVERRFGPVPPAFGAEQELKQVFLNLILNAAHAVGESGRILLSTESDGRSVRVRVQDDGCGIGPDALEKVFDPFYTTKDVGEGTGMGLFVSYEIVRAHGGTIAIGSEPGHGTTVTVQLPADPS